MKSIIEDRLKELNANAQVNIGNHQALLGRIAEATYLLELFFPVTEPIIGGATEVTEAIQSIGKGEANAA